MDYRLSDILDIPAIQSLMESFYGLTGIPFGLLDLDGNILAGIGWQRLCTEFHRADLSGAARCLHSDRQIAERVRHADPGELVMYKCQNGLMETVLPIMIRGEHYGNFILGQFLFEPPDETFFRAQAKEFGFNEHDYMAAVREIPVFSREAVDTTMRFYSKLVDMMVKSHAHIAEIKRMEYRLRRLASIVDQAREGILLALPNGSITYANAMSEEIIPAEHHPLLEQSIWSILTASSVAPHLADIKERLEQGASWQGRIRARGDRVPSLVVEASLFPIKDGEGNITNLACIFKDISETIALEARLTQTQKMEAIGTLAGGIAHDFNNILSAILGFTHLSLGDETVSRRVRARLQKTAQAADRASELVQQILNFSRSDPNVRAPVSLRSIVVETFRLLRASLPVTITLEKKLRTDGQVMGDQSRLHQMLMNLCTNAGQAMEGKDGTLTVELEETRAEKALCGFSGPAVVIRVSDTGQGIDPEIVKQIFTPFFTTRGMGRGTGLGLSLVHSIVADHGGSIRVSSAPGQGSTFSIYLPAHVSTKESVGRMKPSVGQVLPGGSENILVVDDEPMVAEIIADGLEQLGYRVTAHSDPQEAVLTFGRNPDGFDLIISDLTMPIMSGVELFRAARTLRRDIPFILCTGYALDSAFPDIDMSQFSAVIPKPVSSLVLATAVRNCLD